MSRLIFPLLGGSLFGVAVFALLAASSALWTGSRPATCMPDNCFCEAVRDAPIRQPANTASGLAFLPAAAAVFGLASRRRRAAPRNVMGGPLLRSPVYVAVYAGVTLLIGLGTAFYHASLSFPAQTADVLGMYLMATLFVLLSAARVWKLNGRVAVPLYVIGNAALLWGLIVVPQARRYVFGVLVLIVLGLELATSTFGGVRSRSQYFLSGVGAFAVGLAAWTLDITHAWCTPSSYIQGHVVWHLAGAAALVLMSMHYMDGPPARDHTGGAGMRLSANGLIR